MAKYQWPRQDQVVKGMAFRGGESVKVDQPAQPSRRVKSVLIKSSFTALSGQHRDLKLTFLTCVHETDEMQNCKKCCCLQG
jgi:hypothetical protein